MFSTIRCVMLFSFFVIVFSGTVFSQNNNQGNIVYIQTWDFNMPSNGSWAEFDSLSTLITEHIDKKNDKILSQRLLRHLFGSDSGQLILIREFASIYDIVGEDDTPDELFKAHWKTEEERKAFNEAFGKYWQGAKHSDEIYSELRGSRK